MWDHYLRDIALLLDKSIDRSFQDFQYYKNPYEDDFEEYIHKPNRFIREKLPNGDIKVTPNDTKEDKAMRKKYVAEEIRLAKVREKDRNKALDMLKKNWDNLID